MSDSNPPDDAQTARAYYDRMLAETRKFSAEQNRLADESGKLLAEGRKLTAGALKYDRERTTLVITATAAVMVAGGVIGGLIVRLLTGH